MGGDLVTEARFIAGASRPSRRGRQQPRIKSAAMNLRESTDPLPSCTVQFDVRVVVRLVKTSEHGNGLMSRLKHANKLS